MVDSKTSTFQKALLVLFVQVDFLSTSTLWYVDFVEIDQFSWEWERGVGDKVNKIMVKSKTVILTIGIINWTACNFL